MSQAPNLFRLGWQRLLGKNTLAWAIRAMRRELLGFSFDYSVLAVLEAASPGSLHYHIYSDALFLEDLEFDSNGVAMRNYRALGRQYNPVFVAWWGLVNLDRYVRHSRREQLQAFFVQVEWLKANAVEREDGAVIWPCHFDWQEGFCRLRSPWISAMYQGIVISALVRWYRITGDKSLLDLCLKATKVFERPIEEGGVRTLQGRSVLYEEYPGYPLARVLDGFLFSLLGLYDLGRETGDAGVIGLFEQGVGGLLATIDRWDYRGKWSWYGSHGYLCPPQYHNLNCVLLTVLGTLTGEKTLSEYADRWQVGNLTSLDKAEIFSVFTLTKNVARLRLPRN